MDEAIEEPIGDGGEMPPDPFISTNTVSRVDLERIVEAFDRMATEMNAMLSIFAQGLALSVEPLRDRLEKLKTDLGLLRVEETPNNDTFKDDTDE